jgi:hypothetical protein
MLVLLMAEASCTVVQEMLSICASFIRRSWDGRIYILDEKCDKVWGIEATE